MIGQQGVADDLNKIVRFYFDAKEDYRLACKRATDAESKKWLDDECFHREGMHKELQEAETRLGVDMSDNGHVGADFKRDWERVRGLIAGGGLEASLKLARVSDEHAIRLIEPLLTVNLKPSLDKLLRAHLPRLYDSIAMIDHLLAGRKIPAELR